MSDTRPRLGQLCECGCGQPTATSFNKVRRFIHGHSSARFAPSFAGDEKVPKRCPSCKRKRTRGDFAKSFDARDGRQPYCKGCMSNLQRRAKDRRQKAGLPSYAAIERRKLRREVLTHYSDGIPRCACCDERTIEFLSIDHIKSGGARHRRILRSGAAVYRWLRRTGYPRGYQVLCHNCNQSLGQYGYCPHNMSAPRRTVRSGRKAQTHQDQRTRSPV